MLIDPTEAEIEAAARELIVKAGPFERASLQIWRNRARDVIVAAYAAGNRTPLDSMKVIEQLSHASGLTRALQADSYPVSVRSTALDIQTILDAILSMARKGDGVVGQANLWGFSASSEGQ